MDTITDPYLTSDQAAQRVGIDRATILRLVRDDVLAGKRFGSHIRTRETWLVDWLCRPDNTIPYVSSAEVLHAIAEYEARVRDALRAHAFTLEQIADESGCTLSPLAPPDATRSEESELAPTEGRRILGIEFLTTEGVARAAAVSKVVVLSWIRRGELQAKMVGKHWLVARLWFEEFYQTPDAGPVDTVDPNAKVRRARLRLIREHHERQRADDNATRRPHGSPPAAPMNEAQPKPRRGRGRPRKIRPEPTT